MKKQSSFQSQSRLQQTPKRPTNLGRKAVAVLGPTFSCLGLLLILLAGIGCKKTSMPQQAPLPVNVATVIEQEGKEWDEFTGRLEAGEAVEIRPRGSGDIPGHHFEAG